MNSRKPHFIEMLEHGLPQVLCIYGTSLSYHMAPHLRNALTAKFEGSIKVVNSGMSGKASRTGLQNLQDKVINNSPDALLLEFAVNDAHTYFHALEELDAGITFAESRANLESMLDMIQVALPACEVILQITNPAWDPVDSATNPLKNRPYLEGFYEQYREVARARGLQLLDNYPLWAGIQSSDCARFEQLIPDGVHPTPEAIKSVLVPYILAQWAV